MSHEGVGFEAEKWKDVSRIYRRMMGMALQRTAGNAGSAKERLGREIKEGEETGGLESVLQTAGMLRHRVRYFTDGAVIGSKAFVNEVFVSARERFTAKRKDGARRMRGSGKPSADVLWSMRDLRVRV
jgi:hypothetical protein